MSNVGMAEESEEPSKFVRGRARTANAEFIRERFDDLKIEDQLAAGKLRPVVRVSRTPRADYNQPPGTLSQLVELYDFTGTRIAEFHQYLLPDGTIGASGRRDPKGILVDGVYYRTL